MVKSRKQLPAPRMYVFIGVLSIHDAFLFFLGFVCPMSICELCPQSAKEKFPQTFNTFPFKIQF